MQKTINQFIWKYSARQQIVLALMTIAYFPALYAMLELPKIIINSAISVSRPHEVLGFTLSPVGFLVLLCAIYFIMYLVNGLIKLVINIKKGVMGERMVRRLRYKLIEQLLRFPIQRFRKTSQGEIVSQITAEAEPLNGYISDALALPLFQGGTMITILSFMFIQNVWLGLASITLIPLQIFIIPKLQYQINILNRRRVRHIRQLSEHIGETVSGAQAIRVHGVQRYVLANFSMRMDKLFTIRYQLYKKKFLMKFLNNFINQMTPFFFYLIGGILVLKGQLTLGALVASIAAYKDMISPWNELLKYYQIQQDAKIKYEQLVEQFDIDNTDESDYNIQVDGPEHQTILPLRFTDVVTEDNGHRILERLNFELAAGEHLAIIEANADKRTHIAELALSLRRADYGSIWMGNTQINDIPGSVKSRRLAYQPSSPPIFNTSMYENILLSIKHQPTQSISDSAANEARRAGNSEDRYDTRWLDYPDYQFKDDDELFDWYVRAMQATGEDRNMTREGLFSYLAGDDATPQSNQFIRIRNDVAEALRQRRAALKIQPYNEKTWYPALSIAENLAFGKAIQGDILPGEALQSVDVEQILYDNGFSKIIDRIGQQIALFISMGLSSDYSREQTMLEFKLSTVKQADDMFARTRRLARNPSQQHTLQDKAELMQLFLNLVIEDHNEIKLPGSVISKIIFLRDEINNVLTPDQRTKIPRFEIDLYHPGLTVLENILFAQLPKDISNRALVAVLKLVERIIEKTGLDREIMLLTLKNAETGIGGSLLSPTSRQGMPLVRVLIKKPEVLIFNDGLSVYDEPEQLKIKNNIGRMLPNTAILWLSAELRDRQAFDRVIELDKTT